MSYYVIGIGGTGAKCVEALTHLCAAGIIPAGEMYALFVDPDAGNGSLERAQITIQQYLTCKKLKVGQTDLFKTPIVTAIPDVWTPFSEEARPTLESYFKYNGLRENHRAAAHLFDVLYSSAERSTPLDKGFRGHPSIGAGAMARAVSLGDDEPWRSFRDRVAVDIRGRDGAKIFLIGSIFGGTGAAGFPTIAQLIRNELKSIGTGNARVGGALLLPYFSFTADQKDSEVRASSENFLLSTQAALKYYAQKQYQQRYDAVYVIGYEGLSPMSTFSVGSKSQRNEQHFIEIYAALAAKDFFGDGASSGCVVTARNDPLKLDWNDLPDGNGGKTIRNKLGQLTKFAFAYLAVYRPMLEDIRVSGRGYRAPWFVNLIDRKGVSLHDDEVQEAIRELEDYCKSFLLWVSNVHKSSKDLPLNLININPFQGNYDLAQFGNLVLPLSKDDSSALGRLWESMCDKTVRDPYATGFGLFVRALYDCCGA